MRKPQSGPGNAAAPRPAHRFIRSGLPALVVCLAMALHAAPPWAQDVEAAARLNATSSPQSEVPWMSGGVGDEAREEMRRSASAYNVHIVFSARNGDYLAAIPVTVTGRDGHKIHSGVSEGPLLYLKLSPGAYRVAAEIDGVWQMRRIEARASGPATRVVFVATGG